MSLVACLKVAQLTSISLAPSFERIREMELLIANIALTFINLVLVGYSLKMLTEYWKDKKK